MRAGIRLAIGILAGIVAGIVIGTRFQWRRAPGQVSAVQEQRSPNEMTEQYLREFNAETRDPEWAKQAEDQVTSWMSQLQGVTGRLHSIACKTRSCVAEVQWATRMEAAAQYTRFLTISSPTISGCTSFMYLDPKDVHPFRASLILNECRRAAPPL